MAFDSMDMEAEQVELPMTIQNHTYSKNTQLGHEGVSDKPSIKPLAESPAKGEKVSLLSPMPLSDNVPVNPIKSLLREMRFVMNHP